MKLLLISLFSFLSFAQIESKLIIEFGNFINASSFTISPNGIIYITDSGTNELISYDTLGNKFNDIGGFGWQGGLFDNPVDVFANALSVYVADRNNHRIQQFDRFLNYVGSFSNRSEENFEYSFGFPQSVAVSNQGDMYILDGENNRVLKFNMFGNFLMSFAGLDAGRFSLKKPISLAVDSKGIVFVADDKVINIYDSFGNGLNKVNIKDRIKSVRIIFDNYLVVTNNAIIKLIFENGTLNTKILDIKSKKFSDVKSAFIFNNKLYLLLFNKIQVYSLNE